MSTQPITTKGAVITASWWIWVLVVMCTWFSGAAFGYVRGIDISRKRIRAKKEVRRDAKVAALVEAEAAELKLAQMREALSNLVDKLRLILPKIDGMCAMEAIHGRPYSGPTLTDELKEAERILADQVA